MNEKNISVKKNLVYNVVYQIVTLLMPLITVPYISRVLGASGIGISSYTNSLAQYFVILGTIGISLYGNRQIAYVRDDKKKLSTTFWAITILKTITTLIALVVYIIVFGREANYREVFLIQGINILVATFDISWLFMGLEDFKKTVTRNLIVRVIGVILIFTLVKNVEDVALYVFINVGTALLGNLSMWPYLKNTVTKVKISISDITCHIKPALVLFIPQIAIQIYAVLDKSMLGMLSNTTQVGLYQQSQSIVKLVLGLVTSLGVVMLPRMSNIFANGDNDKLKKHLNKSLIGVSYIAIPMAFGLASISESFVPWFFGRGFGEVKYLLMISVSIVFFIALSNVLGVQYLLPTNRNREFTISVTVGAIVNVILNFLLIPKYDAFGSCIATVIAEFSVTLVQYIFIYKEIELRPLIKAIIKYTIAGIIMTVIVIVIGRFMKPKIITTLIQCVVGVIIYFGALIIIKDETNKIVFKFIKEKIEKSKN
ncbi:flippase [uncultured Clostridium sp.]|uniref:flippase n=1 Tax=uncultured Clostridium sp. TaxID=59620 RepID=UPI0026173D55|nr:flippase [uncultured Clostridium sp.]